MSPDTSHARSPPQLNLNVQQARELGVVVRVRAAAFSNPADYDWPLEGDEGVGHTDMTIPIVLNRRRELQVP